MAPTHTSDSVIGRLGAVRCQGAIRNLGVSRQTVQWYTVTMILGEDFQYAIGAPSSLFELCRRFHVLKLELFGSAATGIGFKGEDSDLDLLVQFEPLEPGDYASSFFGLHEALEALSGRAVDLLTEAALENPHLRTRIDAERRLLFSAA